MTFGSAPDQPTLHTREWLEWLQYKSTPAQLEKVVERVAFQTEASIKEATPVRFEGQVRRAWNTLNPGPQPDGAHVRIVRNDSVTKDGVPIMLFIEEGTANNGTGYIEPKTAKNLYIPLTRRAAGGWRSGLKWGVDYILRKRVRGAKGQHIVAAEVPKVRERLREGFKLMIREILTREGIGA